MTLLSKGCRELQTRRDIERGSQAMTAVTSVKPSYSFFLGVYSCKP